MATKTFDELKQLAIQIRDEKTNKQNTANRVGTAMLEGINKLEQDYYDKTAADKELKKRDDKLIELANNVGLYNVDKHVPLGGGFYTSATARAAVPSDVRKVGLIITYKTDATTSVTEQFIGSDVSGWTTDANWKNVGSEGGNKILEWKTDAATTRKKVPAKERKAGMQISYKPTDSDWVNEQYVGTSFTDTEWVKDSNWEKIPKQKQLTELEGELFNKATLENSPLSQNLLDIEGVNWTGGGYISNNGIEITPHASYAYSEDYQEISYLAGKTIYGNVYQISVYDFNKEFIENITSLTGGKLLPERAFYWRISAQCQKTTNEEIRSFLTLNKSYIALSNLGSGADIYRGRKVITEKDFQLTSEQMPSDYVPIIGNGTITKEKLEASILEEIDYKLNKSIGKNLCMHEECLLNQYMNNQGKIISADGYALTGLIPIKNGKILRCNEKYQVSYNGLYDKNRQVIKSSLVQANNQQYLVGTEESAFAQFSFGVDKLSTLMVEEVDSIEGVNTEYEPYTDKNKILNVLGFNEEINHPMLTKQFPFFNKTWMTFCDSFGATGVTYNKTQTLFKRPETYGYFNKTYYTWHRYIADYLQLGGLINNTVSGSCISSAYTQFSPFCTRVDSLQSDESVALALLEGGTNDWYYNVPMGEKPVLYGEQNGTYFNEFDETTLDKGTFKSAFAYVLLKMQKLYPNSIIVVVTPIYAARLCNEYESNEPGYNEVGKNKLGLTLLDYVDAEIEVAGMLGIPVIDGYRTSGINCGNWKKYISDGVHPWVSDGAGLKMYSRMIVGGLQRIFGILPEIPKP